MEESKGRSTKLFERACARLRGRYGVLAACFVMLALAVPGLAFALIGSGSGLTIVVEPPGSGVVTGPGIYCEDECSPEVEGPVTLTAEANPGYLFKGWAKCDSGGINGNKCTAVPKGQTLIAKFVRAPSLTVTKAEGSGLGKVSSSPGGILCVAGCSSTTASFLGGAGVKLKETPARHSHFVEWLGDCTGSGLCEPFMDEDHEVEALFAEDAKHTLTLTKVGDGFGTVKSKPAGIACLYTCTGAEASFYAGETIELDVTTGNGDILESWSGCDSEPEGRCRVTMSADREVVADFGPDVELIVIG